MKQFVFCLGFVVGILLPTSPTKAAVDASDVPMGTVHKAIRVAIYRGNDCQVLIWDFRVGNYHDYNVIRDAEGHYHVILRRTASESSNISSSDCDLRVWPQDLAKDKRVKLEDGSTAVAYWARMIL
jgi:hypothetical protein